MNLSLFKKHVSSFAFRPRCRAGVAGLAGLLMMALPGLAQTNYSLGISVAPAANFGTVTGYYGSVVISNGVNTINDPIGLGVEVSVTASNVVGTTIFSSWSGSLASSLLDTNAQTTILTIENNGTLVANFDQRTTLSLVVQAGQALFGTVSPSASTVIPRSKAYTITATPNAGYEFVRWNITQGSPVIADPLSAQTTIIPTSGNVGITAVFQTMPRLTVTAPSDGSIYVETPLTNDMVSPSSSRQYPVPTNGTVTVTAMPGADKEFLSWFPVTGVVLDPSNSTTTISMNRAKSLTVQFQAIVLRQTLITHTGGNGTVVPLGTNSYIKDSFIDITASADAGYIFLKWVTINNGPVAPVYQRQNPLVNIQMNQDRNFKALFTNSYTITVTAMNGPGSGVSVTNVVSGDPWSLTPPQTVVGLATERDQLTGWKDGLGDVLPIVGAGSIVAVPKATQNSSFEWTWQKQYLLTTLATGFGTVSPDTGVDGQWVNANTTNTISAVADAGYVLDAWKVNGVTLSHKNDNFNLVMTGVMRVEAVFIPAGDRYIPLWWKQMFGLDSSATDPNDAPDGDPDNDGLSNWQEYSMMVTNRPNAPPMYMNPISADTDSDGLDDGFEYRYFDVPRLSVQQADTMFISAAMLVGVPYGGADNPDGDYLWDTQTGYVATNDVFSNLMEYIGPDGEGPRIVTNNWTLVFPLGGAVSWRRDVRVLTANPNDTGDQSDPTKSNTDSDTFDDGYEYSWDVWQQSHSGDPIQTNWTAVVGAVPDWAVTRPYNPVVKRIVVSGTVTPDYDWGYNVTLGTPSSGFDDNQEFQASIISANSNGYPVVRRLPPPFPGARWCTNPFLYDTDGDWLPDGWEIAFGYDPWDRDTDNNGVTDAAENPDGDAYALSGDEPNKLFHHEVYVTNGFSPNVAWLPDFNSRANFYTNILEFLGRRTMGSGVYSNAIPVWALGTEINVQSTNPHDLDSDHDGMHDGWELYVGFNPVAAGDGGGDPEQDGLANWQEFISSSVLTYWRGRINAGATPDAIQAAWSNFSYSWPNKRLPTDPFNGDTDNDQMSDSAEQGEFNYTTNGAPGAGGGLNPCSVDTDLDYLPDYWETYWAGAQAPDTNNVLVWGGGMNGTVSDALIDYDADGLYNYQEYLVGACYQFQWMYNNGTGTGADPFSTNFDPYDFFDLTLSGGGVGDCLIGPGALAARATWDPAYWADRMSIAPYKRFTFLSACPSLLPWNFSTCNPGSADTDHDGYDDFYEIYHNLNPIRGSMDRVSGKVMGVPEIADMLYGFPFDYSSPFRWGELPANPVADFDQDGQVDVEEGLTPNLPAVLPYHHTDPSPYFVADISSDGSWVNKFYKTGNTFGAAMYWYWDSSVLLDLAYPAAYLFSFEVNEGYDTDNDMEMDGIEIVGDTPGATDPLDEDSPLRQRALYLDGGDDTAARLYAPVVNPWTSFRAFTVEAWVRPEAIDGDRVIVERAGMILANNPGLPAIPSVHRNFRLGITNGVPYIGYDGFGQSWVYNIVVGSPNYRLHTNRWAHLAGVFDAQAKRLTLYVNGEMAGSETTQQIPFNGYVAGNPMSDNTPLVKSMNLIVGAADFNPDGVCDGSRDNIKSGMFPWSGFQPGNSYPALANQFMGWVDEIRCWDGARTQAEITQLRGEKLTRAMVNGINGVTTGNQNVYGAMGGTEIIPRLVYAYTFDGLPDPTQGVNPQGFESALFPSDWTAVEWWDLFPMASTVYNNRQYVKWIQNIASHQPYDPPRDTKVAPWRTVIGMTTNYLPGGMVVTNFTYITNFPNTANPYVFEYIHGPAGISESHPQYTSADSGLYGDLLPLGNVAGDDDVPMWDGKSDNKPIDLRDQDGDGLPDSWEERYGLNPFDPSDAGLDPDNDGLTNLQEYQVGGDPFGIYSLDPNQVLKDSEMDSDNDGLANGLEANYGTSLFLPDTDDDGIRDGAEVQMGMTPTDSLSPAISRVLRLTGDSGTWLEGPADQSRFLMKSFTIGAWIKLNTLGGTVIACEPDTGIRNYRLRVLPSGVLAADFTSFDRTTTVSLNSPVTALVPTGIWTHVAASFEAVSRKFTLYYNGGEVASTFSLTGPADTGYGPTRVTVGGTLDGDMDEVAFFNVALAEDRILAAMNGVDLLGAASLTAFYPFDDGTNGFATVSGYVGWNTGHVQDFAATNNDWMSGWNNAATLVGAAQVVELATAPVNINQRDTDGDGLPDGWETTYGTDPNDPTGDNGAAGDPDGDELTNLYEYWSGTNPRLRDTDANGVEDGLEDSDGDYLINLDEQDLYGTHPGLVDTDDDGTDDFDEVIGLAGTTTSDPVNAMSPPKQLSGQFDGTGWLEVPENERLQLPAWTIHAWVNPTDPGLWPNSRMVIVRREIINSRFGAERAGVNYELGLKNDNGQIRPYVRFAGVTTNGVVKFTEVDGKGAEEIRGSEQVSGFISSAEWSHVLGVYDPVAQKLCLYINGALTSYRLDAFQPAGVGLSESWSMQGRTTIGAAVQSGAAVNGFFGYIDDVAILAGVVDSEGAWTAADKSKPVESAVFASAGSASAPVRMQNLSGVPEDAYRPNQVIVRFKDAPTAETVASRAATFNTTVQRSFTLAPIHVLDITDGKSVPAKVAELKNDPNVLYAEPNFCRTFSAMPNDPSFGSLWGLNNTGQSGGTPDADIDAPEAWDAGKGSAGIIVAVLDSGMDVAHPDLAPNVWINSGEIPGNGIDDDGNGYIDDVNGYDFFNLDNDPDDPWWLSHGTHVSGTIGAAGNNGIGVVGVNWNVRLMACKVGDYYLSDAAIIAAFEYAVRMGARVANCSFGGYYYSQAQFDAISAANAAGMLVICAAGNDGLDTDVTPHYPSSYDVPNIISVAASTRFEELAVFSNYGQNSVDVAAPGLDIVSTMEGGSYGSMSGTSMASPHTAGLAALVASMYPAMSHLTWKQMILGAVETFPSYEGMVVTGGRINARKAVSGGGAPVASFTFDDGGDTAEDLAWSGDWMKDFEHAGVWNGGANFSSFAFVDSYLDSDRDGMPDWWEIANGLDPFDADGVNGATGDADGDGLDNYNEYRAGLNPNTGDTDHDGTSDGNEDTDGDGLSNLQEQSIGTDPGKTDTDDDGYNDGSERANRTDPLDAWSPELRRAVVFNGDGRLVVNTERDADGTTDWTVEAWVKPASLGSDGILVRRAEKNAFLTTNGVPLRWVDYELGLSNGVPYAAYAFRDNLGEKLITVVAASDREVTNNWVHLAAVRQFDPFEVRLFVDGKEMARSSPSLVPVMPVSGNFETTIGGGALSGTAVENGFVGQVDAVRIWPYARLAYEIQENRHVFLPEFVNGTPDANRAPRRLFNFDDGGATFQNDIFSTDWKVGWSHAAKAQGAAGGVLSDFAPANFDQDDDGIADYTELSNGWYEKRSDWPYIEKYLAFNGAGEVRVDERIDGETTRQYALTEWTLETWVRDQAPILTRTPLISRQTVYATNGIDPRVTFELGLDPYPADVGLAKVYVRFNRVDAGYQVVELSGGLIPVGEWSHVAAVLDPSAKSLTIYVNGSPVKQSMSVTAVPFAPDAGILVLGSAGFVGEIKEVRIWSDARTIEEIAANFNKPMLFSTTVQNSFDGNAASYIGRPTVTNDGAYNYDLTFDIPIDDWIVPGGWITHPFTLETWIKMDVDSAGGIVMERKVESGRTASGYLVSEGLRIEGDGHLTGYIEGWVTEYTPVYVIDTNTNQRILQQVNAIDVLHRRPLTSELDLRDGKWHHVAFVGDTENMMLYIDGRLDAKTDSYYFLFTALGGTTFEGMFAHIDNEGSVLRVGGTLPDDLSGNGNNGPMFDGTIDESAFWNVDLREDQVEDHMTYGLSRADIQAGQQTIYPIPQYAIDDGRPHHRLVSYVIFDGLQNLPFIRDLVPNRDPYIIMPREVGTELVADSMPPIMVDPLRAYEAVLRGYFACDDGGYTVENYIYRNDQSYAGLMYGNVEFGLVSNDDDRPYVIDTDGDGIPDWWETLHMMDPEDVNDAQTDADSDGLTALQEYRVGTDPRLSDTDGNGVLDSNEDSDSDGLSNLEEVLYGTNPGNRDTDDDGVRDGEEINANVMKTDGNLITDPTYSMSPLVERAAVLTGGAGLSVPEKAARLAPTRFGLSSFTLEAWINPETSSESGVLIGRTLLNGQTNFALRLVANRPVVEFTTAAGVLYFAGLSSANPSIPAGEWTHVAGVFDEQNKTLQLYVNGFFCQAQVCAALPAQGEGKTWIGSGLNGIIDEVRIWSIARTDWDVMLWRDSRINTPWQALGLVANYRFDDGGETAEDFVHPFGTDYVGNPAYSLTNVDFVDSDSPVFGIDDMDNNAISDWWQKFYFDDDPSVPDKAISTVSSNLTTLGMLPLTMAGTNQPFDWHEETFPLTPANSYFLKNDQVAYAIKDVYIDVPLDVIPSSWGTNGLTVTEVRARVVSKMIDVDARIYRIEGKYWNNLNNRYPTGISLNAGHNRIVIEVSGNTVGSDYLDLQIVIDSMKIASINASEQEFSINREIVPFGDKWIVYGPVDSTPSSSADDPPEQAIPEYRWDEEYYGMTPAQETEAKNYDPLAGGTNMMAQARKEAARLLEDPDNDGLSNKYEYYARTNPKDGDTDNDGVLDGYEDPDGDGLENHQEEELGSHPLLSDTDDDGVLDSADVNPAQSFSPRVDRVLSLDGLANTYLQAPHDLRWMAPTSFTVMAWVQPSALGGSILARSVQDGLTNYALTVGSDGRVKFAFTSIVSNQIPQEMSLLSSVRLVPGVWSHVAGVFDIVQGRMKLFVGGVEVAGRQTSKMPIWSGVGSDRVRIGEQLNGNVDELALFGRSLSAADIQLLMNQGVLVTTNLIPAACYVFDDGGLTVQDFAGPSDDWLQNWRHAGVLVGGAVISDGVSANAPILYSQIDSDNDGIPDGWEIEYGLDPNDSSDSIVDSDGDGLSNFDEYLAGTDPWFVNTDGDDIPDGEEDSDSDGLSNLEEAMYGTDPGNPDTDDDGYDDGLEFTNSTDPLDSWSPELRRSVVFNGQGRLAVKSEADAIGTTNWTVEAWVKPATDSADGVLVRRAEKNPFITTNGESLYWVDYELGLSNGVPYVKYSYRDNLIGNLITVSAFSDRPVGTNWVHLAGVRQLETSELRLFVDGKEMGIVNPAIITVSPDWISFETTIGGGPISGGVVENGFVGQIDAVRVWPYTRLAYEIQAARDEVFPESDNAFAVSSRSPSRLFNFDDGGKSFQNDIYQDDWTVKWRHALLAQGAFGGVNAALSDFVPTNFDQDDDGITDYTELSNAWYEQRSDWPFVEKYLEFDGTGEVRVDERIDGKQTAHYALTTWTVESWILPQSDVTTRLPLVYRRVLDGNTSGVERVTFEIGLEPNVDNPAMPRAYAKFNRMDAGFQPIELVGGFVPAGNNQSVWTHVAAVYDEAARQLSLYLNGVLVGNIANVSAKPYAPESGNVMFGCPGFSGFLKEIRIWNSARTLQEVEANYRNPLLFASLSLSSFNSKGQSYIGRMSTTNDGSYEYEIDDGIGGSVRRHPFAMEAYVKMDGKSRGGILLERKLPYDGSLTALQSNQLTYAYSISESMSITTDGHLAGSIGREADAYSWSWGAGYEIISDIDLRDNQWHHVAFVADLEWQYLYIDGRLDVKMPISSIEDQPSNAGTLLRIGGSIPEDDTFGNTAPSIPIFEGSIDEVMFWNISLLKEDINKHMRYGLDRSEIASASSPDAFAPAEALPVRWNHRKLVSYVVFDGNQEMPYINDLVPLGAGDRYRVYPQWLGDEIDTGMSAPVIVDPLRMFDLQLRGYFSCDDGGTTVENYLYRNDQSYAGLFLGGAYFGVFEPGVNPVAADTDRDGIPDSWETFYKLDPEDAMDAYADSDHDGLGNMHEYRAGSSPLDPMSLKGQTLDFFTRTGAVYRIVGEELTDMDWMDDLWEVGYGLNPELYDATGVGSDPDGDGWSSLAEFQDLLRWDVSGLQQQAASVVNFEEHPLDESVYYGSLAASLRSERLTIPDEGFLIRERWNDPSDDQRYPVPEMVFRFQYSGQYRADVDMPFVVLSYTERAMDIPDAVISGNVDRQGVYPAYMVLNPASTNSATMDGHVREGQNWFWGFMDLNNDGLYQDNEPAGFAGPVNVRWGSVGPIDIPLTDKRPNGFARFSWDEIGARGGTGGGATNQYDPGLVEYFHVYIVDRNVANAPTVFYRRYPADRTWVNEADVVIAKKLGKGFKRPGGFQYYIRAEYDNVLHNVKNGFVYVNYANPMPAPTLVWPTGKSRLRQSLETFTWKMDPSVTLCTLTVRQADGTVVLTKSFQPPARDIKGRYSMQMPIYIGDGVFQNGVYTYTLTVRNPLSSATATSQFTVRVGDYPGYSYSFSGKLVYPGKVTTGNFVVEAYTSPGFGGVPAGRRIIPNAVVAAAWPTNLVEFTIRGLPRDQYYIRAFLDQNNTYPNYVADDFESQGWFAKDFYWPKAVEVSDTKTPELNDWIKVLMRDLDNDLIPDDWEYRWRGNLDDMGPGPLRGYVPALSGVLNVFECYGDSAFGASPN